MYIGVSCPVSSRNMDVGIVFIVICKQWCGTCKHKGHAEGCTFSLYTYLAHRRGQQVDNAIVGYGYDALAINLDNSMAHPDPSSLGNATTKQTANLKVQNRFIQWLFERMKGIKNVTAKQGNCGAIGFPQRERGGEMKKEKAWKVSILHCVIRLLFLPRFYLHPGVARR